MKLEMDVQETKDLIERTLRADYPTLIADSDDVEIHISNYDGLTVKIYPKTESKVEQ